MKDQCPDLGNTSSQNVIWMLEVRTAQEEVFRTELQNGTHRSSWG